MVVWSVLYFSRKSDAKQYLKTCVAPFHRINCSVPSACIKMHSFKYAIVPREHKMTMQRKMLRFVFANTCVHRFSRLFRLIFSLQCQVADLIRQGLFYPSLEAEFRPNSQSKIVTFFPKTISYFPN